MVSQYRILVSLVGTILSCARFQEDTKDVLPSDRKSAKGIIAMRIEQSNRR